MLRPLNNNSPYISLCRTFYLAQGDLGEALRVCYGAKELLVEKEIPQSMLTIRHAAHFPESDLKHTQNNRLSSTLKNALPRTYCMPRWKK